MIIKYILNADGTVPDYVEEGGYFIDPSDATETRIGKAVDSGIPSDAPATTVSISKSDLVARVQSMMDTSTSQPSAQYDENGVQVAESAAIEVVDNWCAQVGIE